MVKKGTYLKLLAFYLSIQKILNQILYWDPDRLIFRIIILQNFMVAKQFYDALSNQLGIIASQAAPLAER